VLETKELQFLLLLFGVSLSSILLAGSMWVDTDICAKLASTVGQFGTCNATEQRFEFNAGANQTAVFDYLLSVAKGQVLVVSGNLAVSTALVYGTLISASNSSLSVSTSTTLASSGVLQVEGAYSSGFLVAATDSSLSLMDSGSLSASTLVIAGGTLSVDLSSSVSVGTLNITSGSTLVLHLHNGDLKSGNAYSYALHSQSSTGSFGSVSVDLSACDECTRQCLTASGVTTKKTVDSEMQVFFNLSPGPGCEGSLASSNGSTLTDLQLTAVIIVVVGVVVAAAGAAAFFYVRRRRQKVELADFRREVASTSRPDSGFIRTY